MGGKGPCVLWKCGGQKWVVSEGPTWVCGEVGLASKEVWGHGEGCLVLRRDDLY